MKERDYLYVIGNVSENSIREYLKYPLIGGGYKGEWFVDVSRCAKDLLSHLLLRINEKHELQEINLQDELIKVALKAINRAVIEELIHAYGDIGHLEVFIIKYKNEGDGEKIFQVLKNLTNIYKILSYVELDNNKSFKEGWIALVSKDSNIIDREKSHERIRDLMKALPKSRCEVMWGVINEFENLLDELEEI